MIASSIEIEASASDALPCFSFTKAQRLLAKPDFDRVFKDAPIRASHDALLILSRPNEHSHARIGLVIAKKHVKRAVDRNKIKRIARETFRLQQKNLPPIDAIVLARRGSGNLSSRELKTILDNLWKRIIKRAGSLSPTP